jgi:diacylglycerol kinase (ATP)
MPPWLRAHGGYLIAALNGVFLKPKIELTAISGVGEAVTPIKQTMCLFTIANTPSFGGGLPIAPAARLDDGEFDCVFADAMSRARLARASLSLLKGTHLDLPEVHSMRLASVRLESDPPVEVYADGEFVCETPIRVRLLPRALRVLSGAPE